MHIFDQAVEVRSGSIGRHGWIGVVAPKGTRNEIVQKLNLEIGRALKDPEFACQISTMGIDLLGSTPDEFAALLRKEIPRWKQIVQDADVKVQGGSLICDDPWFHRDVFLLGRFN
jgi:hypothetical protein